MLIKRHLYFIIDKLPMYDEYVNVRVSSPHIIRLLFFVCIKNSTT